MKFASFFLENCSLANRARVRLPSWKSRVSGPAAGARSRRRTGRVLLGSRRHPGILAVGIPDLPDPDNQTGTIEFLRSRSRCQWVKRLDTRGEEAAPSQQCHRVALVHASFPAQAQSHVTSVVGPEAQGSLTHMLGLFRLFPHL